MSLEKLKRLDALVDNGYLSRSFKGDLVSYNYTDKTTYERFWNEDTLNARGTIYDIRTGDVHALAFPKFFNLNEHKTTKLENLPSEEYETSTKEDGSLGIGYLYDGEWHVATRGSFNSDQAIEATKLLSMYKLTQYWPIHLTPLFEIIYPENKIIVDYKGFSGLVLIGAIDILTGKYLPGEELEILSKRVGIKMPLIWNSLLVSISELTKTAETLDGNEEGWVIRYKSGLMVKIKGKRYMELAKFKANLAPLMIWKKMMNDSKYQFSEFLTTIPEEFREETNRIIETLNSQSNQLMVACSFTIKALGLEKYIGTRNKTLLKDAAAIITSMPKWMQDYMFGLVRSVPSPEKLLLVKLRPVGNKYIELKNII